MRGVRGGGPWLVAALCLGLFWIMVDRGFAGGHLGLGSINLPTPGFTWMAWLLSVFGAPAAVGFALGLRRGRFWSTCSVDRDQLKWLFLLSAVLLPLVVRELVTLEAPLTDDEGAYWFSAQLLRMGRLWVSSPPMKLFFDNAFLVNDGRVYSQYFLGWPAFLALGGALGIPQIVNPLMHAVGAWAISTFVSRWWGRTAGLWALALWLVSPMAVVSAATLLSHSSCSAALAVVLLLTLPGPRRSAGPREAALLALVYCVAFFIRPVTALGFAPLLVVWAARRERRLARWATFAVLSAGAAALFLVVNEQQTGHPLTPAYQAYVRYVFENGSRFAPFRVQSLGAIANIDFNNPLKMFGNTGAALLRLNVDLFGWPSSLALALLARRRPALALWGVAASLLVVSLPVSDGGIDTFGPVHYSEMLVPLVPLTVAGMMRVEALARRLRLRGMGGALVLGFTFVSVTCYLPIRWSEIRALSTDIRSGIDGATSQVSGPSVLFVIRPLSGTCTAHPSRHFVFFRPNSSPTFDDELLWVNHVSLERDQQFMAQHPVRRGYLAFTDASCKTRVVPLEQVPTDGTPRVEERPGDFD